MFESYNSTGGASGLLSRVRGGLAADGIIWTIIQRALLIVGALLLAIYVSYRVESYLSSRAALGEFAAHKSEFANSPAALDAEAPASPASQQTAAIAAERATEALAATAGDGAAQIPVAVLNIPKIRLEVPVLDGTDDRTLRNAVGRIRGTARPGELGNIGIAGHRDTFFRGLKDLKVGDAIALETPSATDIYIVEQIQIVSPDHVEVLQPRSAPALTLVTCYPFHYIGSAPQRYIVTASLVPQAVSGPANFHLDPPSQQSSSSLEPIP